MERAINWRARTHTQRVIRALPGSSRRGGSGNERFLGRGSVLHLNCARLNASTAILQDAGLNETL